MPEKPTRRDREGQSRKNVLTNRFINYKLCISLRRLNQTREMVTETLWERRNNACIRDDGGGDAVGADYLGQ